MKGRFHLNCFSKSGMKKKASSMTHEATQPRAGIPGPGLMRRRWRRSSEVILRRQEPKPPQGEEEGRTKGAQDQEVNMNSQVSKI